MAAAACTGWLPFLWRLAEPGRGRLADRGVAVGARLVPVRRLLGRPAAGADRPVRASPTVSATPGRCGCWAASPWSPRSCSPRWSAGWPRPRPVGPVLAAGTAAVFTRRRSSAGRRQRRAAGPAVHPGRAAPRSSPRRRRSGDGTVALALLAGIAGTCAALVKQSQLDVFVRRAGPAPAAAPADACCSRASRSARLFTVAVAVLVGRGLGTAPGELWDAAGRLPPGGRGGDRRVRDRHDPAPARRACWSPWSPARHRSSRSVCSSGCAARATYGVRDLRWPALAVLGWELVVVLAGRQLLAALPDGAGARPGAARRRGRQRRLRGRTDRSCSAYAAAVVSTVGALVGYVVAVPIDRPEAPVIDYLRPSTPTRATPPWSRSAAPTSCARPG